MRDGKPVPYGVVRTRTENGGQIARATSLFGAYRTRADVGIGPYGVVRTRTEKGGQIARATSPLVTGHWSLETVARCLLPYA